MKFDHMHLTSNIAKIMCILVASANSGTRRDGSSKSERDYWRIPDCSFNLAFDGSTLSLTILHTALLSQFWILCSSAKSISETQHNVGKRFLSPEI